ncbi:MAG: bifunctional riboflavin kinase/FAD synthetase [Lachnospiraceae bacterium]|nr:bifunctional riboflavin kinase/FAD synthetase [Lachnospiraceae bacterium]
MEIITYDEAQLDNSAVALGKFEGVHKGHMLLIDKIVELAHQSKKAISVENKNEKGNISAEDNIKSVVFTINMPDERVINLEYERYEIFEQNGVDYVCECSFDERISRLSPYKFIKDILVEKLDVSYVVVGADFRFGYKRSGNVDTLKEYADIYGYKVIVFDKLKINNYIVSSSAIKAFLDEGAVDRVREYMGRAYSVSGEVVYGKQLGRTIGFPTVNLIPDKRKKLPLSGAYETRVYIDGDKNVYRGITNVGNNPTVDGDFDNVETHIINFSGDLYGRDIRVEFIRFIRHEIKFKDIDELKAQLVEDKKSIKK